jgi:hypothetical protein
MAGTIELTSGDWHRILHQLESEYPMSWTMIRFVQKRELGFTVRTHREWQPQMVEYVEKYYLDFFDDTKETWFRMKYL